jgi:hypothetical protein
MFGTDIQLTGKKNLAKIQFGPGLVIRFAKNEKIKGFPALAFVCWCSKNTKLKTTTIRSKKESKEMEKIILR